MKQIYFFVSSLSKGGAERVIITLAEGFWKFKYQVKVITLYSDDNEYILTPNIERINLFNRKTDYYKIKFKLFRVIIVLHRLLYILKKFKPDYLISFLVIFYAVFAGLFIRTKVIISIRNDPEKSYNRFLSRILSKTFLPLAAGCIFQTSEAQKFFPRKLVNKSIIIENPINSKFFNVKYKPELNYFISVGRLVKQKNHLMLLKAAKIFRKKGFFFKLEIFGVGEEKKNLMNFIKTNQLSNFVTLKGSTENIENYLSKASIFILPSNYEGMPNALMEAMAVGVPSISTDCPVGGPRILLDNNRGVLVNINDHHALANKLELLYNNKQQRLQYSKSSKIFASNYKTSLIVKRWVDYIERYVI